jgi:uncharacterized protein (DUF58 family)
MATMSVLDDLRDRVRARLGRSLQAPRKLKFTREGRYFTGMTLLVGFGAINTGNNLLYLLLGMMLALIILSGVLSENVLQKLEVQRRLPERIFAKQPAIGEITLYNHKTRFPSLSIQILEKIVGVPDDQRPAAYFLRVEAKSREVAQYRFSWPRRGRWKIEGVEVITRFPFELFRKSRSFDEDTEVLVYPQPEVPPQIAGIASLPMGDVRRHKVGQGAEFHGLRDYRDGEDIRAVHWKTTARRGELILKDFEEEEARQVFVCVDHRWSLRAGAPQAEQDAHRAQLERAISVAAGLAQELLGRGYAVGLGTLDEVLPVGTGAGQWERILRTLALARLAGDPADPKALAVERARFAVPAAARCLLVHHGPTSASVEPGVLLSKVEV